jgi:nucleoside-diphosphate-sugar epimerase
METVMKIAVLGANGRLSHAVAKAFLAHGHQVIAVTRSGRCEGLTGAVELRKADAMKAEDLVAATHGADMIFNGLNPLYTEWSEKCVPMARNVMAAAKANRAIHLFIGNVYNYGKEIPMNADEDTPSHASTEKAEIRMEMEGLFDKAAREEGIQTIILRAGDFYGTDKKGTYLDLVMATKINRGIFTWPGPYDVPHCFAYLPDLAEAFVRLAERHADLPPFSQFNFAGHTLTGGEFADVTETVIGRKLARKHVPWMLFKLAGLVYPMAREVARMNYLWFTPHSLNGEKLEGFLGPLESTPPADAIRQTLIDQGFWYQASAATKLKSFSQIPT